MSTNNLIKIFLFFGGFTVMNNITKATEKDVKFSNDPNVIKTLKIFNDLNKNSMDLVNDYYDEAILFEDPFGKISGLKNIRKYYENMYEKVTDIRFDFHDIIASESTYTFPWILKMKVKNLAGGEEIQVPGVSLIKFNRDGKVFYHRDYFDAGKLIYENIPVLGFLIKKINSRFHVQDQQSTQEVQ